jgi:hypothetical protein
MDKRTNIQFSVTVRMRKLYSDWKTKNLYDQHYIPENGFYMYVQNNTGFPVRFSISCSAPKITRFGLTALTISHVVM